MDTSTIVVIVGLIAASLICLKPGDWLPMAVNVVLITGGTLALLWMLDNPQQVTELQKQAVSFGTDFGTKALIFIACQPFVFLAARWLAKRLPNHPK